MASLHRAQSLCVTPPPAIRRQPRDTMSAVVWMSQDGRVRRAVGPLLSVTVALVLADSAVVTLALPDILRHLETTVTQVAWVLISFNLVLGFVVVPTAVGFARMD